MKENSANIKIARSFQDHIFPFLISWNLFFRSLFNWLEDRGSVDGMTDIFLALMISCRALEA
jgi:hypothetical protein